MDKNQIEHEVAKILEEKCVLNRKPLFHESFPIILFWSEKSGCTSLLKWFFFHIGVLKEARKFNPWLHEYESAVFKDHDYTTRLAREIASGKPTVKLVRNPYPRAVSSFLTLADKIAGNKKHWAYEEWRTLRRMYYGDADSQEGITFRQFLQYLAENNAETNSYNPHIARQHVPGEEQYCTDYIRLENLRVELRRLERQHDLPPAPLARLFSSPHHRSKSAEIKWTPDDKIKVDIFGKVTAPPYRNFFGEEELELVRTVFELDFHHYGYKRDELALD